MLKAILAAFALSFALVWTSAAAELTPEQHSALEARIASFDEAMRTNDMQVVMGVVPPKVLDKIATTYGVTVEALVAAAQQQIDELMKSVKIESFGMDLATAKVEELPNGRVYVMIPTETVIDLGEAGGKIRTKSETLGLEDEQVWYLVRAEDPQQAAMLKEIYPEFADVEFKPATTEPVTP